MKWSDAFVTGIEIVDQQHQGLVKIVNQLAELLLNSAIIENENADSLINSLLRYVAEHFETEEQLMRQYAVDSRHSLHHTQAHRDFADKVAYALEQFSKDQAIAGVDLLRFLSNWLVFHILGEDQKMAREIHAIRSGLSPTQAFDSVQGCQAEISNQANDVLVNALVNLYSQLSEQHQLLIQQNASIAAAHAKLDGYREILEQQVAEKTKQLQTANDELRQALDKTNSASQAKTRFMGIISHELLTPINVILGFSSLIENAAIPGKQREQAKKISQAGRELNSLLNEVLTYSRLDSDELNIEAVSFLPGALLSVAADRLKIQALEKGLELNTEVDPGFPYLIGDEEHLRQAIEILLSNAIKYTDQGRVGISAQALETTTEHIKVEFAVSDSGIGIPLAKQNDLFQQFQQLNSSTTRRHKGIGLGLAICSRLVALMGGELNFDSQPNVGSTFRIILNLKIDQSKIQIRSLGQAQCGESETSDYLAVETLATLLADGDLAAQQLFVQLAPFLSRQLGSEIFNELSQQIHSFRFEQAQNSLRLAIANLKTASN